MNLDTDEERAAYDDGYDSGYSEGTAHGFADGKKHMEKTLISEFDKLTATVASKLAEKGYTGLAQELREWALMTPHARSILPPFGGLR